MSMHIEGPWLSTTGKRKSKRKFRNAAEAQKARDNAASWNELWAQHEITHQTRNRKRAMTSAPYKPKPLNYRGSELPRIPSRETTWEPCTKPAEKVYTGTAMVGVATMHKSNSIPVFSAEQAVDISKMRR